MKDKNQFSSLSEELINNFPTGICVINPSGDVLIENPALKNIFAAGAGIFKSGLDLYHHIESDSELQKYLNNVNNTKKSARINQLKYSSGNGKIEKYLNVGILPIVDEKQAIKYYFLLVEDVTENALLDCKMHRSEKLSAMGIFASGIAEELKWPINHISLNLDFVERNTSEDSPVKSYIQAIKDDLSRIKFVSKQIMDLSLPHRNDNKEVYEVNKLFLTQPLKVKLSVMSERGIKIKLNLQEPSPKVKANENQLIHVLAHLIQNSAEAMPQEGTLTLSVASETENDNEMVVITIADTGFGIGEENLANIFKPFFTTKGHSATGLGLVVAYSIIDNLGGAIGIKSKPGSGTAVRIVLPAHRANQ